MIPSFWNSDMLNHAGKAHVFHETNISPSNVVGKMRLLCIRWDMLGFLYCTSRWSSEEKCILPAWKASHHRQLKSLNAWNDCNHVWSPYPWDYVVSDDMLDPWVDGRLVGCLGFFVCGVNQWSTESLHLDASCTNLVVRPSLMCRPWKVCIWEGKDDGFPTNLFQGRAVKLQGSVPFVYVRLLCFLFNLSIYLSIYLPPVMMSDSWHFLNRTPAHKFL